MIPKIIVQTSIKKPTCRDLSLSISPFSDWKYFHFDDKEALKYIVQNPIKHFPNAHKSYLKYKNGAHRADFFRYWFLYINGGFFIDSDLSVHNNLENFVEEYSFISCEASAFDFLKQSIYQGFLLVDKNNKIIFECLKSMYLLEDIDLCNNGSIDGYLSIVKRMYCIIENNRSIKLKLLSEEAFSYISPIDNKQYIAFFIKNEKKVLGVHWQQEKIIHNLNEVIIL